MEDINDIISQINHIKESIKTKIGGESQSLLFQKFHEVIGLQQRKIAALENEQCQLKEKVVEKTNDPSEVQQ